MIKCLFIEHYMMSLMLEKFRRRTTVKKKLRIYTNIFKSLFVDESIQIQIIWIRLSFDFNR